MYLQEAGVEHGDICDRNVCLEGRSVQLIDFSEKAEEYTNDIIATSRLMRLCVDSRRVIEQEAGICEEAAITLVEKQDLKSALTILKSYLL
jgi:predicted Ser/Thr protein kinase